MYFVLSTTSGGRSSYPEPRTNAARARAVSSPATRGLDTDDDVVAILLEPGLEAGFPGDLANVVDHLSEALVVSGQGLGLTGRVDVARDESTRRCSCLDRRSGDDRLRACGWKG